MVFKKSKKYLTYDGNIVQPVRSGNFFSCDCVVYHSLENLKKTIPAEFEKYSEEYILDDKLSIKINDKTYYTSGYDKEHSISPIKESDIEKEL